MSSKQTEAGLSTALGSTPEVNFDRAFKCTVTIAGTGLGFITLEDIKGAIASQHPIAGNSYDQMYVHEMRAYGSAGGYLSMAPYPHRQMAGFRTGSETNGAPLFNTYGGNVGGVDYDKGTLCQLYEFGISGSTRPHLKWTYPKNEILNNPFIINSISVEALNDVGQPVPNTSLFLYPDTTTKVLRIQSTNTGGNALYLVQIDVTVRRSDFIQVAPSLGGAAFGEDNVITNNYKPSNDPQKRIEEGQKAEELANKKRKVKNVRNLSLPPLDSK